MGKKMDFQNVRKFDQLKKMLELKKTGECVFCQKYIESEGKKQIVFNGKYWTLKYNDYPYDGSKLHLILVYKKHIPCVTQIDIRSAKEMLEIIRWLKSKFKIKGFTFLLRSGDTNFTGATITHLHAHIIAGIKRNKDKKTITTTVGFKKD